MTTPMMPPDPATSAATEVEGIITDVKAITGSVATASADIATAGVWSAVCGFFTALPGIVALIRSFMTWVNAVSGNNPQAFIAKLGSSFDQLANAKTPEDQQNAAQNLAKNIGNLPS